jgi:phosphoadenosine phosphosulfate reductase
MLAIQRYRSPSADLETKVARSLSLLAEARARFEGAWTQAHSLGAEDVVVTQLLHMAGWFDAVNPARVFVLNTGVLHAETLALVKVLNQRFSIEIEAFHPDPQQLVALDLAVGGRGIFESKAARLTCCDVRKLLPLKRALAGQTGWVTGLRRDQSLNRADITPLDDNQTPVKLSPLADWTFGDVWAFIETHQLPYNALHDAFYPSIGCEPCTRAVSLGEDFRAGRWWWETEDGTSVAKECGLHVKTTGISS